MSRPGLSPGLAWPEPYVGYVSARRSAQREARKGPKLREGWPRQLALSVFSLALLFISGLVQCAECASWPESLKCLRY